MTRAAARRSSSERRKEFMDTIKQVLEGMRTKAHAIDGGIRAQQATSGFEPERTATDLMPAFDINVEVG